MKKLKSIFPQSMLFQVYKALVESHLRYANVIWGNQSNTKIKPSKDYKTVHLRLFEAQKKVFSPRSRLSVDQLFQCDGSVIMFKIINKICPESLHDKFVERSLISKYDTRNKTDLQIKGCIQTTVEIILTILV